MLVIITGGTGFIGTGLSRRLLADGYDVALLTRRADAGAESHDPRIRYLKWDGRTAEDWGSYADGAYAIVNLAGANIAGRRWTTDYKEKILQSRMAGGAAVVEAVAAARVKPAVLVQASAVGYYGSRGDDDLDETSQAGEGFLADVARKWEASTEAVEEMDVRRVVIRSGLVLGADGGAFPRLIKPFKFFAGGPLGSGRQWFPWIHYADEIGAIAFLVNDGDARGIYNLCAPEVVRNRDFSRAVGRALGRPWWWPVPAFALRAFFGDMADALLLASAKVHPERLLAAGFEFEFPTTEDALNRLLE
jgi:uncharacterized protein (TIGR01777 family)